MQVICIQDDAFMALVQRVVDQIKATNNIKQDKWISGEEAMRRLSISSKTTLQKMRDNRDIIYSQPAKKIILYDADSIEQYLEKHIKPL